MRIISGRYRGKQLIAPKHLPVRPTTDFAKEGLFNILFHQFDLQECKVLDLFCGTGNISYEFASRGVPDITSVDVHYQCIKFVQKTKATLGLDQIHCVRSEVSRYLANSVGDFDLIFADPPYEDPITEQIPDEVFKFQLLNEDGWLVVEHSERTDLSHITHFKMERRYGNVKFSIFSL